MNFSVSLPVSLLVEPLILFEVVVDGGADEGVELVVGFAEGRCRVCGVGVFGVLELCLETLLPIGTTRRIGGYLGSSTAACLGKQVDMTLLGRRGRVLLTVAWIGYDIRLLRSRSNNLAALVTVSLATENGFSFLGDFAFEALNRVY